MLPRLPLLAIAIVFACSPPQESSSTADSVVTGTLETPVDSAKWITVENNDLFVDPVDPSEENMELWFPDGPLTDRSVDMVSDSTPWMAFYEYKNGALEIIYYDYFKYAERRYNFYKIISTHRTFKLSNGLGVESSKDDFIRILKLTDPKVAASNNIIVRQNPGKHKAQFQFTNGRISQFEFEFDGSDTGPKGPGPLFNDWVEIVEIPDEGEPEQSVVCNPRTYTITEFPAPRYSGYDDRYTLTTEDRNDEIKWIRKSGEGFVIRAVNSNNSIPYSIEVKFRENDPENTTSEWDGTVFKLKSIADNLRKQPCDL